MKESRVVKPKEEVKREKPEKVEPRESKLIAEMDKTWGKFLVAFLEAREQWEDFRQLREVAKLDHEIMDVAPSGLQKMLSMHWMGGKFEQAIPQLINTYRLGGGVDFLYQRIEEAKEEDAAESK